MKAEISLTFEQLLNIVKQLPMQKKLTLSRELEKEAIESKLEELLADFKTDDLGIDTITQEVEEVRQMLYEKGENH